MAVQNLRNYAANTPANEVGDEHTRRLADAKQQKAYSQEDITECYFFAAPRRARSANSSSSVTRSNDASELQTSLAFECAEDFMTLIIESFMPSNARWAERLADPFLRQAVKDQIENSARIQDEQVFQMIRSCGFHAELAKQGVPDGAIGVFAMHIHNGRRPMDLPVCIGVPIRELEMNLGPDGRIDDRFVVKHTTYKHVKTLLPGITLPSRVLGLIKDLPETKVQIQWGYWRLWDKDDDEYWQHCVKVGEETVHDTQLKGRGCCPLVLGRFGATPDYAWPDGPMIKSLPDLRQEDETRAAFIENIDFTLRSPKAYDDDGVIGGHLENGVEPGMFYPRRPGSNSRQTFESIYDPPNLQAAMFEFDDVRRRVKRLHYVDFPEQVGKTPPTLGQWLDEMVEAQKKIGTPGFSFWREFPFEVFQRFTYIAEKAGKLTPIKIEGAGEVTLHAYNPAQRAQENQEVLTATRLMQIGGSAFPQTWQVAVDELGTLMAVKEKLGDKLVKFKTKEELVGAVDQLSKLGGVFGPKLAGGLQSGGQGA